MGDLRMKLAYVSQYFTTTFRGPVTNLLFELSGSVDVVNFSSALKHKQYYSSGVFGVREERLSERLRVRRYDVGFGFGGLLFPKDLDALLSEEKPSLVQSEEYYQPASKMGFKYAKKNKIPFIFNHRGSEFRFRTLRERFFFAVSNPLSRNLVYGSDAVVCLSEKGRGVLAGIFPGIEEKVVVVPNSINPAEYSGADGGAFRRKHGLGDSPLVVCVARVHPQKRIDLLVRSFKLVKERVKDARLVVVGPWVEAEKRKVDSIIRELDVKDVVFTGPIPNTEVKDAYAAADVVALSSEFEPFGYCILEAMCVGRPVVAFDIGAISEIIADGKTGFCVGFPDVNGFALRVSELLGDRKKSAAMGSFGLRRVEERFLLSANSKRLLELYQKVLK